MRKRTSSSKLARRIPVFKSDREAAEFWDTHSLEDFADELEIADDVYFERPRKRVVALRLEPPLIRRVKALALKMGLSYSTLIRLWIVERCGPPETAVRAKARRSKRGAGMRFAGGHQ